MKMKLLLLLLLVGSETFYAQFNLERTYGTYSESLNNVKLNTVDSQGNIFTIGTVGTYDISNFITPNSYQTTPGTLYIVKRNLWGALVWGTYFNGDIQSATIDKNDNLILLGRASLSLDATGFTSTGSYQPVLSTESDLFLAKFDTSGNKIWGTYLNNGTNVIQESPHIGPELGLSIVTDADGNIYFTHRTALTNLGTVGTFQQDPLGTNKNAISKFNSSGFKVWTTYYGINGSQTQHITANLTGIFVSGQANDCIPSNPTNAPNSYFATANAFQPTKTNCLQGFITKFNFNGQRQWSTYLKVSDIYGPTIKGFGEDLYVTGKQSGSSLATPGAFQEINDGDCAFVLKFNNIGERAWGTYYGLDGAGSSGSLEFDSIGNVYFFGTTSKNTNIATPDGFLAANPSLIQSPTLIPAGFFAKFNPDGHRIWGSYYGGTLSTSIRNFKVFGNGCYIYGVTNCDSNIATPNGLTPEMPDLAEGELTSFIAHFETIPLSTNQNDLENFSIFPNPGLDRLNIKSNSKISEIQIFDLMGKLVVELTGVDLEFVTVSNLSSGLYLLKATSDNGVSTTKFLRQ